MAGTTFDAVIASVKQTTQAQIVETAKRENAKIMARDPRPAGFVRHVDGIKDAPEEAVKAGGVIVYDYDRLDMVVGFALDTLRQLSPVEKGDYVRSHTIFIDGKPVETTAVWREGQKIAIANTVPWARKIERGGKGYRAHPEVYERAERVVNRRFGNIANVSFGYMSVDVGDVRDWAKTTKLSHRGHASTKTRDEWLRRQPALFIDPL